MNQSITELTNQKHKAFGKGLIIVVLSLVFGLNLLKI
jgi:hypothetical protein